MDKHAAFPEKISVPACLLAYNRPDYFECFLKSLVNQKESPYDLIPYLFIDGARPAQLEDNAKIIECIALFKRYFPNGVVFNSDKNIGIAFNWARAEKFAFEVLAAPVALFFEDDLELGPHYLYMMRQIEISLINNHFTAGWSAFSDRITIDTGPDERLIPMRPLWAVALIRSFYLRRKNLTAAYLNLLEGSDYRNRPRHLIDALFRVLGIGLIFDSAPDAATSQDNVRRLFITISGGVLLSTSRNYAKYIGKLGEHFNLDTYEYFGYDNMLAENNYNNSIIIPSDAEFIHDLTATLSAYLAYEAEYVPTWLEDFVMSDDDVAKLKNSFKLLGFDKNLSKINIDYVEAYHNKEVTSLRANLFSNYFIFALNRSEYIKINIGVGKINFMNAILVPSWILEFSDFWKKEIDYKKRITFVIEVESLILFHDYFYRIALFWIESSEKFESTRLWIKLPLAEGGVGGRALSILNNLSNKTNSLISVGNAGSDFNKIIDDDEVYLLTKEFNLSEKNAMYAVMTSRNNLL